MWWMLMLMLMLMPMIHSFGRLPASAALLMHHDHSEPAVLTKQAASDGGLPAGAKCYHIIYSHLDIRARADWTGDFFVSIWFYATR